MEALYNTFEEAVKAANEMVKKDMKQIYFIMNKDGKFKIAVGWDGRDKLLKDGYKFKIDRYL